VDVLDGHHALRMWIGQPQRAVNDAVDGRVGSDAKRERQNSNNGEPRRSAKLAKRVPKVLKQRFHGGSPGFTQQSLCRTKLQKTELRPQPQPSGIETHCPFADTLLR